MKVRIGPGASDEETLVIARALVDRLGEAVDVYVGDAESPHVSMDESGESTSSKHSEDDTDTHDHTMREERVWNEIADIQRGGPKKYRDRLSDEGKLFVRDRLALWFGRDGILFEDGTFANFDAWYPSNQSDKPTESSDRLPADGLLTGAAEFEGRRISFMANDYTVKAGSMAEKGVEKFLRMQERALHNGKPIVYLMDSSGGRIDRQRGFFANRNGIGKFYYNHSMLSGWVPQICVLYGPCIAGAAYTPVFADFTIMVERMSAMAIASPRMVKMVTGEDVTLHDLGGSDVHSRHSGSADLVASDEEHARELVAQLITYLPDNAEKRPPTRASIEPAQSPSGIDEVIPSESAKSYDIIDLIDRLVDASSVLELQSAYGREVVTAFARIGGRPLGIVANQPTVRAGAIFPDSAEKAATFIWKCDAFGLPLLYLCDTPGFMAGSQVEKDGILEKGKKFIYATSTATVPKVTVIVRKAYGAGIYAMGGPAYDPESVLALPTGEIAIMGPEAAINAVFRRRLDDIEDEEERERVVDELRDEYRHDIAAHRMASEMVIDELIPPSRLRDEVSRRLSFYENIDKPLPKKKHGTVL